MIRNGCVCKNCLQTKLHNVRFMSDIPPIGPLPNTEKKENIFGNFFQTGLVVFKSVGMFFLGIIVGIGIVLQKPMDEGAKASIDILKKQNEDLKKILDDVKNGVNKQNQDLNGVKVPIIQKSIQVK